MLASLLEIDLFQELSSQYPVLFLIDDTLQPKYGKKFVYVKVLHDHALHNSQKSPLAVSFCYEQIPTLTDKHVYFSLLS